MLVTAGRNAATQALLSAHGVDASMIEIAAHDAGLIPGLGHRPRARHPAAAPVSERRHRDSAFLFADWPQEV